MGIVAFTRRSSIKRSLLSNYSSSGSSAGSSQKARDQFANLTNTFPQGDAYPNMSGVISRTSFENKNFDNASLSSSMAPSDLRFVPSAKPSISKNSKNLAVFYPGMSIESIVPNPVYVNNTNNVQPHQPIPQEFQNQDNTPAKLITSVYVTNKTPSANENTSNTNDSGEFYENQ